MHRNNISSFDKWRGAEKYMQADSMNSFPLAGTNAESALLMYFVMRAANTSKDSLFADIENEDMIDDDRRRNDDGEMMVYCNES